MNAQQVLHQQVEAQAARWPDKPIVFFQGQSLTYRELNERANRLARLLREAGVRPDQLVGLLAERSLETVVGVLAILKAGGAYLPIDPELPAARIAYMLQDSKAAVLLGTQRLAEELPFDVATLLIDDPSVSAQDASNLPNVNAPNDLAYVIYTSGSTGEPKGVMIEHRSVCNLVAFFSEFVQVGEADKIVQFTSFSFDGSVGDLFISLLTGAELHIPLAEQIGDFQRFAEFANGQGITISAMPPDYLKHFEPEQFASLKTVLAAGSATSLAMYEKWKDRVRFLNCYGPTEATVCTTVWDSKTEVLSGASVPIGRPIANAQVCLRMTDGQQAADGETGEICIGGVGVARGYWQRPELTARKFVPDPSRPGETLYRTGDLGRWLPDGTMAFAGRDDRMVKVRGFRVELDEVQEKLLQVPEIAEAVVLADAKEDSLVAFVTAARQASAQEIRASLQNSLPAYMVPAVIWQLDRLPLSANGKVDFGALRGLLAQRVRAPQERAAGSDRQAVLHQLWQEVLGCEDVREDDHFFDAGGHSLKAAVLLARIREELLVSLSVRELFDKPTFGEMARLLEAAATAAPVTIEPLPTQPYYPVSQAQTSMYSHMLRHPDDLSYNIPGALEVTGRLQPEAWERALQVLIDRHEALRTSFDWVEGRPVQRIQESVAFRLPVSDRADVTLNEFVRPFDLRQAPLFRAELFRVEGDRHLFYFDMHHIIADGLSTAVFLREFMQVLQGASLEPLGIHYKEFAAWQERQMKTAAFRQQEAYWAECLAGALPLQMPTDRPRPAVRDHEGGVLTLLLDADAASEIRRAASEAGTTLNMYLLAVYGVLLHKYTRQEDIVIGSPVSNRPHAAFEAVIGLFFNMVPIRIRPRGEARFDELLAEVKEAMIRAFENRDYPYEKLLEKRLAPAFETVFIMQNTGIPEVEAEGLRITALPSDTQTAKFDFKLEVFEQKEQLLLKLDYATQLFFKETAEGWLKNAAALAAKVAHQPAIRLDELELLASEQKQRVLASFNDALDDE